MFREALHPLDVAKLRHVAEALCDISAGRRLTREGLRSELSELAFCIGSPWVQRQAPDWADGVLDRLLAIADYRLGADEMASAVFAEIMTAEAHT